MPISLEYLRGALDYRCCREVRVVFPTQKTIFESEDRVDRAALSLEEWVGRFARQGVAIPPYMQVMALDFRRPGFVIIGQPDGRRLKRIVGGGGIFGVFSANDLTLMEDED